MEFQDRQGEAREARELAVLRHGRERPAIGDQSHELRVVQQHGERGAFDPVGAAGHGRIEAGGNAGGDAPAAQPTGPEIGEGARANLAHARPPNSFLSVLQV